MTEQTLFLEALAKPASERAAFLDAACAGQPQLRASVESLLAAHEAAGGVLDQLADVRQTVDSEPSQSRNAPSDETTSQTQSAHRAATTTDYHRDAEPGIVIAGRYTLVEKIGEGGMGEVWIAKQTEPVKRRVALKLIKTGMDSKTVLHRFE